jgi:hypothetical protein
VKRDVESVQLGLEADVTCPTPDHWRDEAGRERDARLALAHALDSALKHEQERSAALEARVKELEYELVEAIRKQRQAEKARERVLGALAKM